MLKKTSKRLNKNVVRRAACAGAVLCALGLGGIGCERTPEDVEKWRNAEGGQEKLMEWTKDAKQPMPVRVKALQVLVEKDLGPKIPQLLDGVKNEQTRTSLADSVVPTVEAMWAKKDYPVIDAKTKEEGGAIKVGASESVKAKDIAFYLHPYVSDANKTKLEAILADWLSKDHQLRNRLGRVPLGQALPLAGTKGLDGMMVWFAEQKEPAALAKTIRQYGDDKTKERFDKIVAERAKKEHPDISNQMRTVILESTTPGIVDYLEFAIKDEKSPNKLIDDAMDAYVRIKGVTATPLLNDLVSKRSGILRSVAATRLIELRGEAGVIQALNAMPVEVDKWDTEGDFTLEKDSKYLCNIIKTELKKTHKIDDAKPVIKKVLAINRWPAQVVGTRCVEVNKWADLKGSVEAIKDEAQVIPGWGDGTVTVGQYATTVADAL